jgi:hypothetical protein
MSKTPSLKRKRLWKLIVAVVICLGTSAAAYVFLSSAAAHGKSVLGRSWPDSSRVSMDEIDHSAYDALLRKYVNDDGYVDYAAWKSSSTDRKSLQRYLDQLSRASRSQPASRGARLAFWINAYNAITLQGILQVYPTSSIRNHTSRLGGYNIWKHLRLRVDEAAYSLEQIENEILRRMAEPRIHFAIVCASVGCPRLLNEAYSADKLEEQLTINSKDFFSRRQNFRVDAAAGVIHLSSILSWFGNDFGDSQSARLEYLTPYLPAAAIPVAGSAQTRVKYLDYDWSLNDQSRLR